VDRRTVLLSLCGLSLGSVPFVVKAQPVGRLPRVGYLSIARFAPEDREFMQIWQAWLDRLRELGWISGQSFILEERWADGSDQRLRDFAAELVRLPVDVLVAASSSRSLRTAREATTTIPIIAVGAGDPVRIGLVQNRARPEGNITGVSDTPPEQDEKRLQLLKEAFPGVTRVAFLWNPAGLGRQATWRTLQGAAPGVGVTLVSVEARKPQAIEPAFARMRTERVGAVYLVGSILFWERRARVAELAVASRLPLISDDRNITEAGGIFSYGVNWTRVWQRSVYYVDRILRGARPADLPIEDPTVYDFVINLKSVKALGLVLPPSVLARADQIIE
jgi:putative ABC transport system substrate-binding protein